MGKRTVTRRALLTLILLAVVAWSPGLPYVVAYQSGVFVPEAGTTFVEVENPSLGTSGTAFFASPQRYGPMALWSDATGALRLVAAPGLLAPGTESPWSYLDTYYLPAPTAAGRIVVSGELDDVGPSGRQGLWWGTTYEDLELLALEDEPAPGAPDVTYESMHQGAAAQDDQGNVAFGANGRLQVAGGDSVPADGIWRARPGEQAQLVMISGQPAVALGTSPGFVWVGPGTFVLNGSGQLAFRGGTGASAIEAEFVNPGIWFQESASALLVQVAAKGDIAPGAGGQTFRSFESIELDESGNVSFVARLDDLPDQFTGSGIWSGPPGNLQLVALAGDPAPGTSWSFAAFATGIYPDYPNQVAAGSDALLFSGRLTDGETDGLWIWQDGEVELVAIEGGPAPGTNGGVFSYFAGAYGVPFPFQMNGRDEAIFFAGHSGGSSLWARTATGTLSRVVDLGDTVILAGGPGRIEQFNFLGNDLIDDTGRVALGVVLQDDQEAILMFMPEPNTLLSLFSAVVLLRILGGNRARSQARAARNRSQ